MTPWSLLAWLLLGVGYCLVCAIVWTVGRVIGWPDWVVPTVGAGVVVVALLAALTAWLRARKDSFAPVAAGRPVMTPAMADMVPPAELARRWDDLLPLLGSDRRPVFLALGDDDAVRARLWRSAGTGRLVRDDMTGLAFVVFADCLWVDVPGKFVAAPKTEGGTPGSAPALAASAPGLWEELIRFLPKLPGKTRGVLVFAESGDEAGRVWLGEKIGYLYRKLRTEVPGLWLASARLDEYPGGAKLVAKMTAAGTAARAGLNSPLGVAASSLSSVGMSVGRAAAVRLKDALGLALDAHIAACDGVGEPATVDREAHLLRLHLDDLTEGQIALAEAMGTGPAAKAELAGLFLCGKWGERLAFAGALPTATIPARTRRVVEDGRRGWVRKAGAALFLLAAGLLAWQFLSGWRFIEKLPVQLLDAAPGPALGGPPPVERYAQAREELTRLSGTARLARLIYPAPNRGLTETEQRFAANLRGWLPAGDDPATAGAWVTALTDWANRRVKGGPLRFATLAGVELVRIPAANGTKGRAAVTALLARWDELLSGSDRDRIALLGDWYDTRLFSVWEQGGDRILGRLQTAAGGEMDFVADLLASDPGEKYLRAAAGELAFSSRTSTPWVDAARAAGTVMSAGILGGDGVTFSGLKAAARTAGEVVRGDDPLAAADKIFSAADKWKAYRAAMAALEANFADAEGLSALAADAYDPPATPVPGLRQAATAWTNLRKDFEALDPSFSTKSGNKALILLSGKRHLAFAAGTLQSARDVERAWEATVTAPLADLNPKEALVHLVNGKPVEAFLAGPAQRFLRSDGVALHPAEAFGVPFPFDPKALAWCGRAVRDLPKLTKTYRIGLRFLPVTVDVGAKAFPRGVRFTMDTEKGPVAATCYNYGSGLAFDWSLFTAGDVTFSVIFDSFTLDLPYPGPLSLPLFLASAAEGGIVFRAEDYPDLQAKLNHCGITAIKAHLAVSASDFPPQIALSPPASIMTR